MAFVCVCMCVRTDTHLLFVGEQGDQDQGPAALEALHYRSGDLLNVQGDIPAHLEKSHAR